MKTLRQWLAVAVGVGGFFAISVSPIITMVAVGAAIAVWPRVAPEKQRAARAEIDNAQRTWQQLSSQWDQQAGGARFTSLFNELDQARKQLAALPQERALRIAKLEAERERLQRERYLDRFRIDRASIKGIGTSRQAMLASFGVETASDVQPNRIRNIPGFGEVLTAELLNWRRGHERNFRFNPNEPVDPREVAKVDQELQTRQRALVTTMQQGVSRLQQARQETVAARERLARPLEAAWNDLKLAEAKMRAL
jgi:DNA-binding helix-hairpin-helix protein with protein kinase domain